MPAVTHPHILDIEASGFGPFSYPIEIGLALGVDERYSTLIKPGPDWTHWDDRAEQVHRISRQTLTAFGKPIDEVAEILNDRLGGQTLYSDGWVVDKPWLSHLFHTARRPMQFQLSPIEQILDDRQMAMWGSVKQRIIAELKINRHRASQDAWVIQQTWLRTRQLMQSA